MNYPCASKAVLLFRALLERYEAKAAQVRLDAIEAECGADIQSESLEVRIRELEVEVSNVLYWFRAASQYVAK